MKSKWKASRTTYCQQLHGLERKVRRKYDRQSLLQTALLLQGLVRMRHPKKLSQKEIKLNFAQQRLLP